MRDPIEVIMDDLDRFITSEIVGLSFELHAELTESTPVNLGWARANFVPAIASPWRENLKDAEPSSGAASSKAAKVAAELARISVSYKVDMGPLYISNNVPYIGRLNDGHSPQAPPGYIETAIERAIANRR